MRSLKFRILFIYLKKYFSKHERYSVNNTFKLERITDCKV